MSERPHPELDDLQGATGWHSRIRYAFARQGATGKRVLDLACGNGFGTVRLAEVAASVVGADVSDAAIRTARASFSRPNIEYIHVARPPFPFADGEFDRIVCLETLEHMRREDQPAFIADLLRMLAPDGTLVLSTPDRDVERSFELATGGVNPWHLHTPSRDELATLLASFPHRREFHEVDVITTLVGPVGAARFPDLDAAVNNLPCPIAVVYVCSRVEASVREFGALPIGFREEPRLSLVHSALDSRPEPLRWVQHDIEQELRIAAGLQPSMRPGSSAWWHRQAMYAYIARLAQGRRILDLGCGLGWGASRLVAAGGEVLATSAPSEVLEAARHLHGRPSLTFAGSASLLPDTPEFFDLIVCLAPESDPPGVGREELIGRAFERLTPTGILFADRSLPNVAQVEIECADIVGTAIYPTGAVEQLSSARLEERPPSVTSSFRLHALSRSTDALSSLREASSVCCLRGDFQREALAMELFYARRTLDFAGFAPEVRDDVLALRLARLEEQMDEQLDQIRGRLAIAYQHRPLFSVRAFLNGIRRKLTRGQ